MSPFSGIKEAQYLASAESYNTIVLRNACTPYTTARSIPPPSYSRLRDNSSPFLVYIELTNLTNQAVTYTVAAITERMNLQYHQAQLYTDSLLLDTSTFLMRPVWENPVGNLVRSTMGYLSHLFILTHDLAWMIFFSYKCSYPRLTCDNEIYEYMSIDRDVTVSSNAQVSPIERFKVRALTNDIEHLILLSYFLIQ